MSRLVITLALAAALSAVTILAAAGQVKQHGRAIVEYRSADVLAVASYEYAQRNHDGAWLLIEFAVQATRRIAIERDQLTLIGPGERRFPLATQPQYLEDQPALKRLLQNAAVWRRSFESYFTTRPTMRTIQFFSAPGGLVIDSAVTNLDEVATGDLFFKSPDGKWSAGTYQLVLNHKDAKAELPILLQ